MEQRHRKMEDQKPWRGFSRNQDFAEGRGLKHIKVNLHSIRFLFVFVRFFTFLLFREKVCAF